MKIPFLKQIQRLTGSSTHEVVLESTGPESLCIEQALQHLLAELPDLLMASVVEVATGKLLASYTVERDLRPRHVAGYNAEAVRQVRASLLAQAAGQANAEETVQEMLFTLVSQVHLLRLSPSGRSFIYFAADCHDTNLGIAREVMRSAIELLEPLVPA